MLFYYKNGVKFAVSIEVGYANVIKIADIMQINRKKLSFSVFVRNSIRMFCDNGKNVGDNNISADQQQKKLVVMEKVCSVICFLVGSVFLVMALLGAWRYFFTMGLCYAVGIMVYEDDDDKKEHNHKNRR